MRVFTIFLSLAISAAVSANAEEILRPPVDPQHQATQMFAAEVYESDDTIFFSIPEKKLQYYIAKPNNPAYPAIVENEVLGRRDDIRFKANGFAKPDNAEAAKWLAEIDEINKAKLAKIKGTK